MHAVANARMLGGEGASCTIVLFFSKWHASRKKQQPRLPLNQQVHRPSSTQIVNTLAPQWSASVMCGGSTNAKRTLLLCHMLPRRHLSFEEALKHSIVTQAAPEIYAPKTDTRKKKTTEKYKHPLSHQAVRRCLHCMFSTACSNPPRAEPSLPAPKTSSAVSERTGTSK
ncbi:hypothetical protein GQ54DRAFT_178037 [Martensiomyces pterosporus]|nr:hypothetical protein GQ54DRAFT_178037 [Martensiomyces pterosporus]